MKKLNAGPFHGPARNAYIQTGPVEGGETLAWGITFNTF